MVAAGVVEGWQALDAEIHLPPDDPHVTDEPVPLPGRVTIGMKSRVSARPSGEEAGQEHVGVGQVELVAVGVIHGSQREMTTLLVVEDGAEDARRVESGRHSQSMVPSVPTSAAV